MFAKQAGDDRHSTQAALPSPRLFIIADDLTGACDAAVAFIPVSQHVRVHLQQRDLSASGIQALTTNTRDLPPAAAAAHLAALATSLPPGYEFFKKIDSVFRGNTLTEIATTGRLFSADLIILAPAYPAVGRTVHTGVLTVHGPASSTIHVRRDLHALDCESIIIPAADDPATLIPHLQRALLDPTSLLLCDASTQIHLDTIVRAARSLNVRTLWIGAGGLAHALANHLPRLAPPPIPQHDSGRVLFFIGSDHPATRGQVHHLRRMSGITSSPCALHAATTGDHLFHLSRDTPAADIQRATAHLHPQDIGCLFLTGGDTALLVCNALGITSLKLLAEFEPGVPIARAEGGRFDGVSVILKSGGFGDRTLLRRIVDAFAGQETASAT